MVLVLDDEPEILIALTDLLEDSYHVLSTTAPARGLEILAENPDISVIISDQRMPGMTGDAFLARARDVSDAQAILLTGYADIGAVAAALNQGRISFYSHKPWDADAMLAMVRQAADRFRLEGELRTERMLLGGLLGNLRAGLSFKDSSGRFVRLNVQAAAPFGRLPEDCVGRTEVELCRPDQQERVAAAEQRLAETGRDEETFKVASLHDPASGRWHEMVRVQLAGKGRDLDGHEDEGLWSVAIDRDVTARVEMEQRLRQAEKMQALGTLAGGIAHDFNNLLTAVLGSLELVGDLMQPEPSIARLIDNATKAAQRGAVLTRRLLNFSRPRDLQIQNVDVAALIGGMSDLLTQSAVVRPDTDQSAVGGACVVDTAAVGPETILPPVRTDAGQLEMALLNLCINARDAMPSGGRIAITAHVEELADGAGPVLSAGRYVVIAVSDEGLGMSAQTVERIFEPFFTTKDIGRGTGLGLSMVYGFVRHCGGDVRVDSTLGGGTRMELWLPASEDADPSATVAPEVTTAALPSKPLDILVVDDEDLVRGVTAGFLEQAGHRPRECGGGPEALDLVASGARFDLVVMDLLMPVMGGVETARRLAEIWPDMRVVFVTGFADMNSLPDGARVLAKPFTPQDLLSAVSNSVAG